MSNPVNQQDWDHVTLGRKKNESVTYSRPPPPPKSQYVSKKVDRGDPNADDVLVTKSGKSYDADFRRKLQQARQAKNLSQKELAQKVQVTQVTIAEMESGKGKWNGPLVSRIERVLGKFR